MPRPVLAGLLLILAAAIVTLYAVMAGPLWLVYVGTALAVGSYVVDPPTWLPRKRS